MAVSIEGMYRNGKIELAEVPSDVPDETRVVVTFPTRDHVGPIDSWTIRFARRLGAHDRQSRY